MGFILSKFRRAKPSLEDSLEKVDKELTEIRRFQIDTEIEQKRIIGRLSLIAFLIYAVGIVGYYLFIHTEAFTWAQHALSLLPFLIFPLLIWSIRRMFAWWYQRKIVLNRAKVDSLRKERERLLDQVMDTETFKVAKKILEKYAPSHLLPKYLAEQQRSVQGTPVSRIGQGGGTDPLRRRTMGGPSITPMGVRPPYAQQFRPTFRPQQQAIMPPPGTPGYRGPSPSMSSTGFTPTRFMLPQAPSAPIMHNRRTGWFDKLADYVVGDGPTHRYALICRYCATHNGLAPPEDFPYTGYRCIYCRQFNPPKQQRPSAATLPRNTVLIEEMDSSMKDSSGVEIVTEGGGDLDSETEQSPEAGSSTPALIESDAESERGGEPPQEQSTSPLEKDEEKEEREEGEKIPFADEDEKKEEEEESVVEETRTEDEPK